MDNIILFWNLFDYNNIDFNDPFFTDSNIGVIVNVIENLDNFTETSYLKFLDKAILESNDSKYIQKKIRDQLKPFETNIFKVIIRNFNENRSSTAFEDVFSYYQDALSEIDKVYSDYSLSAAVFFDTPHHPFDYISYLYLKFMSVKVIVADHLPFVHSIKQNRRAFFNLDFPQIDDSFFDLFNQYSFRDSEYNKRLLSQDMQAYLEEYRTSSNIEFNSKHYGDRWRFHYLWNRFFVRLIWHLKEKRLILIFKKLLYYIDTFTFERIDRIKLLNSYNKLSISNTGECPYLYFPLHLQPEASSVPLGNEYSDQLLVVDYLTKNLQDGVFLYVREHPAIFHRISSNEKIKTVRSAKFYDKLNSNPKVKLVSLQENHLELVKNSLGIVTLTGTVAFEAFGLNKLAFIFGDRFYSDLANSIKSPSEKASQALSKINNEEFTRRDFSKEFLATLCVFDRMSFVTNDISNQLTYYSPYLNNLKSKL